MDYSKYKYLSVDVRKGIAFVTLNRPEKLNACNLEQHAELPMILRDLAKDDDVRAAVVTGAGRAFCIGGDLDWMAVQGTNPEMLCSQLNDAREVILAHIDLEKPIIAAVNGYAMGAGSVFALYCDFVILERQALIADGHVRAALLAGDGGALIWPLTIGLTKAKQYLLTGDWITAEDAERFGLVTEVVEEGQSLKRATQIAERLAAGPQTAIRWTKRSLNQWLRVLAPATFDYSLALQYLTWTLPDARKTLADLIAKKPGAMPPDVK